MLSVAPVMMPRLTAQVMAEPAQPETEAASAQPVREPLTTGSPA